MVPHTIFYNLQDVAMCDEDTLGKILKIAVKINSTKWFCNCATYDDLQFARCCNRIQNNVRESNDIIKSTKYNPKYKKL